MNETRAFCPACKQDVVFQNTATATAAVCPACGASFDLANEVVRKRHLSWRDGVLFALWIFVPAVIALLSLFIIGNNHSGPSGAWMIAGLVLASINSYCACSWLTGRFTQRLWVRVLVGIVLGLAVLSVNAVAAAFGGCAFAYTGLLT
jgi:hypothetical protein